LDQQSIFDWILGIGGLLVGWMLKLIWDAIREVKTEIKQLDSKVHQDFVRRDDFKDAISEMKTDMREGFSKVDQMLNMLSKKLDDRKP
jgi:hypothetical protein